MTDTNKRNQWHELLIASTLIQRSKERDNSNIHQRIQTNLDLENAEYSLNIVARNISEEMS